MLHPQSAPRDPKPEAMPELNKPEAYGSRVEILTQQLSKFPAGGRLARVEAPLRPSYRGKLRYGDVFKVAQWQSQG